MQGWNWANWEFIGRLRVRSRKLGANGPVLKVAQAKVEIEFLRGFNCIKTKFKSISVQLMDFRGSNHFFNLKKKKENLHFKGSYCSGVHGIWKSRWLWCQQFKFCFPYQCWFLPKIEKIFFLFQPWSCLIVFSINLLHNFPLICFPKSCMTELWFS